MYIYIYIHIYASLYIYKYTYYNNITYIYIYIFMHTYYIVLLYVRMMLPWQVNLWPNVVETEIPTASPTPSSSSSVMVDVNPPIWLSDVCGLPHFQTMEIWEREDMMILSMEMWWYYLWRYDDIIYGNMMILSMITFSFTHFICGDMMICGHYHGNFRNKNLMQFDKTYGNIKS